jgi:hypothetical protein
MGAAICDGRFEETGEGARSMESILAEEPLHRRSWVFKLGVWAHGGILGEVKSFSRGTKHITTFLLRKLTKHSRQRTTLLRILVI